MFCFTLSRLHYCEVVYIRLVNCYTLSLLKADPGNKELVSSSFLSWSMLVPSLCKKNKGKQQATNGIKIMRPWQQLESKLLPSLIALFILQYKNGYSRKEKVKSSSLEVSSTQPGTFDQEPQHKLFKVFPVSFCWVIINGWFAISSFT